jgi:hypothetical protein
MPVSEQDLHLIADIVGIVSGTFTIVGISGIVTWSLFGQGRSPLQETILDIAIFSIKSFLCLVLAFLFVVIFQFVGVFAIMIFTGNSISTGFFLWDAAHPIPYIAGYAVEALPALPLYVLCCLCIFQGSMEPFIGLGRRWKRVKRANTQ